MKLALPDAPASAGREPLALILAVICLSAAALFSLLCFGYTGLFVLMTDGGALSVDDFIRVCGAGFTASFGAVCLAAETKAIVAERRAKKKDNNI